jgi:transposase
MTTRHELTDAQKGAILALIPLYSHAEIGARLGINRRTISHFVSRTRERESIENLPHPGRPRKLSDTAIRYLVRTAESNTHVPFEELRNLTNIDASIRTIRLRLREGGIRKWRAVKRPFLTPKHAKQRLAWAKAHQHWTVDDWKRVIWSDECPVQKDSNATGDWVFRRQNKREKYAPHNVRMKARDGHLSQMIWACFVGDKLGPIVFLSGSVNQDVYMELLCTDFEPFLEALAVDGVTNLEFEQDNAHPHVAKRTRKFLEALAQKHGLTIMDWPANSPDLSPIENLWAHLQLELRRQFPDTAKLKGSPQTIKAILRERLHKIWWEIGEDVLNDLIEGMPKRVKEVITARGWYTSH